MLANTNNKFILRVLDAETQKYLAEGIPKIKAQSMSVRYLLHRPEPIEALIEARVKAVV